MKRSGKIMGGDRSTDGGRKLLTKMVRFVTNPTTQWSQLDQLDDADGAAASQSRLKGLIARKKHDDVVRGRELGMLRKLLCHPRHGASDKTTERYGRSPTTSGADTESRDTERARTLQKIDALDAQMKAGRLQLRRRKQPPSTARAADTDVTPSTQQSDAVGMQLGPEIEEVAIHFANGNFSDAEAGLRRQMGAGGAHRDDEQVWLMLFDLYRATGQSNKFNDLGADFADRFQRSPPQWQQEPDAGSAAPATPQAGFSPTGAGVAESAAMTWRVPTRLSSAALLRLPTALHAGRTRLTVDWRGLEVVDAAALPALAEVFRHWADQNMLLICLGVPRIADLLAERTSSHDKQVDADWWAARLALLRLLDRPEAFDETALAYCMTYEVSPPAWTEPRCRVVLSDDEEAAEAAAMAQDATAFAPTVLMPDRPPRVDSGGVFRVPLKGDLLGDIDGIASALVLPEGVRSVECDCRQLRRVDFGAAGALFNWVSEQQGRDCHVVFVDVNRLVAVFFEIIGIADVTAVLRSMD